MLVHCSVPLVCFRLICGDGRHGYCLCRLGINQLKGELAHLVDDGLRAVLVFGVPEKVAKVRPFLRSVCVLCLWRCASFRSGLKDEKGTSADSDDNPAILAAKKLRELFPKLLLVCDVCLCPYTNHGHCGMWIFTSAILDVTFWFILPTTCTCARDSL